MSLKSKIEAVIYASEEPVTLAQLVGLLAEEALFEVEQLASMQSRLPLEGEVADGVRDTLDEGTNGGLASASPVVTEMETKEQPVFAPGLEALHLEKGAPEANGSAEPGTEGLPASGENVVSEAIAKAAAETQADPETEKRQQREKDRAVRDYLRRTIDELIRDYAETDRGIEVREVAGGFRMGTKPEYHDAVRGFVRSLKPALKLSLQALETLAVVAYKQPVTAAEISEVRGVDSAGVLGGLMARKLIVTAGRKQVIGRPMLYKTTKEFLVRFGLKDVHELPSMEEFERMAGELNEQEDLPMEPTQSVIERANARGDADHIREATAVERQVPEDPAIGSFPPAEATGRAAEIAFINTEATHVSRKAENRDEHTEPDVPNAIEPESTEEATA